MSSHGSDQIAGEKRAASPEVTAAAAVPAADASGKKAKEVYNVRLAHMSAICMRIWLLT
jgi:hypothetical protein